MIVQCLAHQPGQGEFAGVVIRGDRRLSLKKAGALLGDKALRLASGREVVRVTGSQIGSVSVLGFRRDDIAGYEERQVLDLPQVIISAGRPDVSLELAPEGMVRAMGAQVGDLCEESDRGPEMLRCPRRSLSRRRARHVPARGYPGSRWHLADG
jgi:prolyl-tRNA editing enzyme YbaK/EbsC (Cys-tRNA(Pro) deacylase)